TFDASELSEFSRVRCCARAIPIEPRAQSRAAVTPAFPASCGLPARRCDQSIPKSSLVRNPRWRTTRAVISGFTRMLRARRRARRAYFLRPAHASAWLRDTEEALQALLPA